jgi:hypothetical protein
MGKGLDRFRANNPNYRAGQDFYPDRLFRDEQSAVRQFWDSPQLSPSLKKEIEAFPSGKKGQYKQERVKSDFIKDLRDLELRGRGTESRYHPGAVTTDDEPYFGLSNLLAQTRAKQMEKYDPYYAMTAQQIKDVQPRKSMMHGFDYGGGDPKTGLEYWKDYGKGALRSGLNDIAWLQDALTKGVSQTFWPVDKETTTGGVLPRGWKDLAEYTSLMGMFDQSGLGISEDEWDELGLSEKKDLNEAFKEMTRSPWDYDPTYHPLTDPGGFKDLIHEFSEDYLMPSSDYLETAWDIPNPFAFRTSEDKDITYTDMNAAELSGSLIAGGGLVSLMRKLAQKFGPLVPKILRNHPYLFGGGAGTTAYTAGEILED